MEVPRLFEHMILVIPRSNLAATYTTFALDVGNPGSGVVDDDWILV